MEFFKVIAAVVEEKLGPYFLCCGMCGIFCSVAQHYWIRVKYVFIKPPIILVATILNLKHHFLFFHPQSNLKRKLDAHM